MNDPDAQENNEPSIESVLVARWNRIRLVRWTLVILFLIVILVKNVFADSAFKDGLYFSAYTAVKQLIAALVVGGGLYVFALLLMPRLFYIETKQGASIFAGTGVNSVLYLRLLAAGSALAICCVLLLVKYLGS